MSWREEFLKSIKSFDTEEKLDLFFYRPFGFLIAKTAKVLHLSPTHLTLIGLVLGLTSGYFFAQNAAYSNLIIASVLLVMAGVFDSSDGQLARMGGKSTKLGIVLDGLCDNLVFASAYIGSTYTVQQFWGPSIWAIGLLAGASHSFQSSMLDYYNREFLYFGNGKTKNDYWNSTLTEAIQERASAKQDEKFFWQLRFSWVWQQNKLSSRSDELRYRWKSLVEGSKSEEFQKIYGDYNRLILRAWRLLGPNFHTILILSFVFLKRFDYYLIFADIIFLTIALLVLRKIQYIQDAKLDAALRARGLA